MSTRITIKEKTVFDGNIGWKHDNIDYKLACAPVIVQAPNGDLLCTWLSGADSEPASDNCILLSRSCDGGETWSEPRILVAADEDGFGGAIIFNAGDKLVMLSAKLPVEKEYAVWNYSRSESFDNGYTWSTPTPIKLVDKEGVSVSLCYRINTSDGRILIAAQTYTKRNTPLKASAEQISLAKNEEEAVAMTLKEGMTPIRDVFANYRMGCTVFETDKDFSKFEMLGVVENRPLYLGEPTIIELKSGRLTMLMRAEYGGYLWRSDSDDGGRTWCDAYQTDIKNPSSLANLLRLPDGRIALFHNNVGGVVGRINVRDPLSVWVSDDEMESWYIKEDVRTGGHFSYPAPYLLFDGRVVYSYDLNRRQSIFVEVNFD